MLSRSENLDEIVEDDDADDELAREELEVDGFGEVEGGGGLAAALSASAEAEPPGHISQVGQVEGRRGGLVWERLLPTRPMLVTPTVASLTV